MRLFKFGRKHDLDLDEAKKQRLREVINQKLEDPTKVTQLDKQIMDLQKSTRTSIPLFIPIHNWLRMRIKWYYNWHSKSYSNRVHWWVLALVVALVSGYLTYDYFVLSNELGGAAGTCNSNQSGSWTSQNPIIWSCGHVPQNGDSVTVSSGNTVTLAGSTSSLGSLGITGTLTANNTSTITTTSLSINSNGVFNANDTTSNIGGDFTRNGTFNYGTSTINFTGSGSYNIPGNTTFYNLKISSGTYNLTGSMVTTTINGNLEVNDPGTLTSNLSSYSLTIIKGDIKGSGTINFSNDATNSGYGTSWVIDGNRSLGSEGNTKTWSLGNFAVGNTSGSTAIVTKQNSGNIDFRELQVGFCPSGDSCQGIVSLLANSTEIWTVKGADSMVYARPFILGPSSTFTPQSCTFKFAVNVAFAPTTIIIAPAINYYNLTIDNPINNNDQNYQFQNANFLAKDVEVDVEVDNDFLITSSGNKNVTVTNASAKVKSYLIKNLTINPRSTLLIGSYLSSPIPMTINGNYTNNGIFTHSNGTVTFAGTTGTQTLTSGGTGVGQTFYNLVHSGTGILQLSTNDIVVGGNFINSAGTFNENDRTMTITGNYSSAGIFNGNTGTVILNNTTADQSISGASTFNNLTINKKTSGTKTITFESGKTQVVTGLWKVDGNATGTKITLTGTSGNWTINPTQTNIRYVTANNSTSITSICAGYSNGTGNSNWNFSTTDYCIANLAQYYNNQVLADGAWTKSEIEFRAKGAYDSNYTSIQLCVEAKKTPFTDVETLCGDSIPNPTKGVMVDINVKINTLADSSVANDYHWQAAIKVNGGSANNWTSYKVDDGNSFGVDKTAPVATTIVDDPNDQLNNLSAHWTAFNEPLSGFKEYFYAIGKTSGGTDVVDWTTNNTSITLNISSLNLQTGQMYYISVKATDNIGNISTAVSSSGQQKIASISYFIDSNNINLKLTAANNFTDSSQSTTITTTTNAYNGYSIYAFKNQLLTSSQNPSTTINDFTATWDNPAPWDTGYYGFGFSSSFINDLYAKIPNYPNSAKVANHPDHITANNPVNNEPFIIKYKASTDQFKTSSNYTTNVTYIVVPNF